MVANTPNDGSQAVTIPNVTTTTARIMVVQSGSGVGVRFFNMNTANFTIAKGATTTTVVSSVNPSVFGQPVTFTATVAPNPATANTPGGTVQFFDGATLLGSSALGSAGPGQAALTTGALAVATHPITAVYGGDANFTGSTSAVLSQVVDKAHVIVALTSSVNPSGFGQGVVFTATVTAKPPGAGTPTGTVQFSADGVNRGGPVTTAAGVAHSPSIASLLPGSHTIVATYSGDGNFYGDTGTLTQVVTCTKTITGTHVGSLLVGPGSVCILDATIGGSVQARPGSAVYVARSTIDGSVSEDKGSVLITRTNGSVLIGDGGDNGAFGCAGNTIGGTLSISKTTGSAEASANRVGGSISLSDTTSTGVPPENVPQLEGNRITSGLACLRNAPAPVNGGQPNTAGGVKSGQCKTL